MSQRQLDMCLSYELPYCFLNGRKMLPWSIANGCRHTDTDVKRGTLCTRSLTHTVFLQSATRTSVFININLENLLMELPASKIKDCLEMD